MAGLFTDTIGGVTEGDIAVFANRQGDIKTSGVPIISLSYNQISPNGTISPPASNIIDNNGVVYTIKNGNGYQNGVDDGGRNMDFLLYFNGHPYCYGASIGWFVFFGGGWCSISGDPRLGGLVWRHP